MPQATFNYSPNPNNALQDGYQGVSKVDPDLYNDPTLTENRITANDFVGLENEALALINGRTSSNGYRQPFYISGILAHGDPVYLVNTGQKNQQIATVAKANATDATHANVIGFVSSILEIGTHQACYLDHFWLAQGDFDGSAGHGGTVGAEAAAIYLSNTGSLSGSPGTISFVLGQVIDDNIAQLFATPMTSALQIKQLSPIGEVVYWLKHITGTPLTLPPNFLEANGQVITDPSSPLHGITLPDLNGAIYPFNQFYLKPSTTSGNSGGAVCHLHYISFGGTVCVAAGSDFSVIAGPAPTCTNSTVAEQPYYTAVAIVRIK